MEGSMKLDRAWVRPESSERLHLLGPSSGGEEGLLGLDLIIPVKPTLSSDYDDLDLAARLQSVIETRCHISISSGCDRVLYKLSDRLAAASEAVRGCPRRRIARHTDCHPRSAYRRSAVAPSQASGIGVVAGQGRGVPVPVKLRELTGLEWTFNGPAGLCGGDPLQRGEGQAVVFDRLPVRGGVDTERPPATCSPTTGQRTRPTAAWAWPRVL
ncbi:hypothetical protein GGR56DRAFT_152503 [Xylariaceae sp. FL0804]|nr:hypothetical protein GGR56DRAFT_152503 [Xylariaceae sp. FL0804]